MRDGSAYANLHRIAPSDPTQRIDGGSTVDRRWIDADRATIVGTLESRPP